MRSRKRKHSTHIGTVPGEELSAEKVQEKRTLITRRALFKGTGAIAVTYSASEAAFAESVPDINYDAGSRDTILILYLGRSWRLHNRDFGPAATLKLSGTAPDWKVLVEGSVYPGTKLSANGEIRIFKRDGVWCIGFNFKTFGLEGGLLLADWMSDTHQPTAIVKGYTALGQRFPHKSVSIAATTVVGLARATDTTPNMFFLEDETQAIIVARGGLRASVERFTIAIENPLPATSSAVGGAGPLPPVLFDRLPRVDCTVLLLERISVLTGGAALAVSSGGASFGLSEVAISGGRVRYFEGGGAKTLVAVDFHFAGTLAAEASPKESAAAWPTLPIDSGRYHMVDDGKSIELSVMGRLPDKAFLTTTGHVRLILSGVDEREILRARAAGGVSEVKSFSVSGKLYSAFVPMHAADYSRFDFRDTKLDFVLDELVNPSKLDPERSVFVLGNVPVFGAVLHDNATLSVHRAADLLDLKYGFRNLYLRSTPEQATIEKCATTIGGVTLPAATPAMMIVHFPPQHIAEKAFLRVSTGVKVGQSDIPAEEARSLTPEQTAKLIQQRRGKVVPIGEHRAYETGGTVKLQAAVQAPGANHDKNLVEAKGVRDADYSNYITKKFAEIDVLEALDRVVEARAAGPTRIAFEIPEPAEPAPGDEAEPSPILPLNFSLDALTDWTRLKTKVSARALPPSATTLEQLAVAGITPATPMDGTNGKLWSIRRSLFQNGAPSADETSIEFPYRLQLSPSNDARWSTPPRPDAAAIERGVPPFHAHLDSERGGRSVRAIWSTDFNDSFGAFLHDDSDKRRHPPHSNNAPWLPPEKAGLPLWLYKYLRKPHPYRMSLDGRDRHELVLLSSVYGLPALLPMPTISTDENGKQHNDPGKPADPYVVPLPEGYTPAHNSYLGGEGLYVPRPLSRSEIRLSALGATVDLEGQWDPPSGYTLENKDTPLWPALTVERWKHRAFQGRDMFVEIVYKGFIFPFGHRCSVVKATERSFYPDPRSPEDHSATVAYLTQRFFVLIGEPEKRYPAVGQPFAGRAMPYAGVRILTTKSPAIMDPFENWIGEGTLKRAGAIGAYAFFPKIADGKDVEFEFEVTYPDGRASKRLAAPLIVADNTLAHDPQAVQELIAFYNSLDAEEPSQASYGRRHRQVSAFDQKLKYAAERDGGDTEFRTRRWLLGAHAREIEDPAENGKPRLLPFMMDAVMEGADQPPFYPAIETAEVEIQSLNAMNGATEGFTEVGHDLHFLRYGFAPGRNDAEVYLAVHQPNFLKLENRSNASGGIATPNNRVLSISRLKGPVGGGSDTPPPSISLTLVRTKGFEIHRKNGISAHISTATPVEADPDSGKPSFTYDLPASHQNKFDPLEFFGKALSQAKLFGIIPLKDVVRAISFVDGAPEMIERTVYSLLDLGDEFKTAAEKIARNIREAIAETNATFESKLAEFGNKVGVTLTKHDIYPELSVALTNLESAIKEFESAARGYDPLDKRTEEPVLATTSTVAAAANRALTETRKVVRKPTPAIVEQAIKELQEAVNAIKNGFENAKGLGRIVAEQLAEQIIAEIKSTLSDLVATEICDDEPLFPLAALALTGYPDTVYKDMEDGTPFQPVPGKVCIAFDIANPDHRRRAQETLLYEVVGKPLIDGYMAIETLVEKVRAEAVEIDTAFRELPGEIISVVEKWLDGILKLEQYAAVGNAWLVSSTGKLWTEVIEPALADYVVPLIYRAITQSQLIREKGEATNTKITEIYSKLQTVIKSGKAGELHPQLEQAAAMIAKAQKALMAVLAAHDEVRTLLGSYFDLTADPDSADFAKDFIKPLETYYIEGRVDVIGQLNGLVGRLFVEKDALFRRSRDLMAASITTLDLLGRVDEMLEASVSSALVIASVREDLKADVRTIVLYLTRLTADVGELITVAGSIDYTRINENSSILKKVASVKSTAQKISLKSDRVLVAVKSSYDATAANTNSLLSTVSNVSPGDVDAAKLKEIKAAALALANSTDTVIAYVFGEERVLAGLISQATSLLEQTQAKVEDKIYGAVTKLLTRPVDLLIAIDELALKAHAKLAALFNTPAEKLELLKLFLSEEFVMLFQGTASDVNTLLGAATAERDRIETIKAGLQGANAQKRLAAEDLWNLIDGWRSGGRPAAIRVFEPLTKAMEILLTGKIGDLVDFSRLETAITNALFSFVPKEIAFDYDWGTKLDPFPSENHQLFWITKGNKTAPSENSMMAKHFAKKNQTGKEEEADDLVIVAKAGVRLETDKNSSTGFSPKPFFAVESQITSPAINLFGKSFDVVTIRFEHLRFTADENGTDFDAKVLPGLEGVQFGKAVDYITKLASLFPKYVPPWLEIMFNPPGVAAKFGFPAFSISIGTLAISNLAVGVRIEIPFDNRPLMGRLSLSERDKPFLISFAPYGGGGYLALRTQATSIVGFELQLEFGAVVVLAYGPLSGFGMVSAGIYIEKVKGQDLIIAGFVRALGEGSLGCFSIAVQIEVRVTQKGSDVTGEATFSYSFKIGFAKFRFSFTAAHAFAGGGGGGNGQERQVETFNADSRAMKVLVDGSKPKTATQYLKCKSPALDMNNGKRPLKTRVQVKNRFDDWKSYSEYFG